MRKCTAVRPRGGHEDTEFEVIFPKRTFVFRLPSDSLASSESVRVVADKCQ